MNFTKSFCMVCGMELRKWIVENNCVSMCTNNKCFLCGIVSKDIVNINNFKINTKLREKINKMDKKDVKEGDRIIIENENIRHDKKHKRFCVFPSDSGIEKIEEFMKI